LEVVKNKTCDYFQRGLGILLSHSKNPSTIGCPAGAPSIPTPWGLPALLSYRWSSLLTCWHLPLYYWYFLLI